MSAACDAIVVGAGHNGLVAAAILARAGQRVVVLERSGEVGGAAVSARPFPGIDARISRYAYLVSLLPRELLRDLGVDVELRRREVSSYTPWGDDGVLICDDDARTRASLRRTLGAEDAAEALERFGGLLSGVAGRVCASLTAPLRSREEFRRLVGDEEAWTALFEQPLSRMLAARFRSDLIRGVVATDALIGTFVDLTDPHLLQNRCFLYHVIGNGTGRWDVPVGGMGALTRGLASAAERAGADVRVDAPVAAVRADGPRVEVRTKDGDVHVARHLLAGVAPSLLAGLIGDPLPAERPEGSQLKLNLLLRRLPRLRDGAVSPEDAFSGTFHVNESYEQLQRAYRQASAGQIPDLPPCEAYCHSLTDPSILGPALRDAGVHTLTVFGLHMPQRLFREHHEQARRTAIESTLRSLDSVLAEPIEDCLLRRPDGEVCLEAHTPVELEHELGLPGGHIFHSDLSWPFAETDHEVGKWGVETVRPNVWICGAGARRGGAVSGIPGHNAARAVLEADDVTQTPRSM